MRMTTASSREGVSLRAFEATHLDDLVQMWRTSFEHGVGIRDWHSLEEQRAYFMREVLPNNDLVLEGIREVDINGDRQFIVLSGIVRAADIGPGNVVPSTAVGQMQIRYFGKGLIKDNLKPGWLVRALNKVF